MPSVLSTLLDKGLEVAPRIIGHMDRNPLSPTYGYFGRSYWAWKNAAMPDASNQYALYYLSLLRALDEKNNPYYQSEYLRDCITAALNRWAKLQHADGSFDQMFPHEHSVGATSYTLLAVLDANNITGNERLYLSSSKITKSIEKAGIFLLENDETYGIVSNHVALFAVTFHELWKFTGIAKYQEKCRQAIQTILRYRSTEGWFKEYEGADPGYLTQCLYYLARLLKEGYQELQLPVERSIKGYLQYFIHPDGSIGGNYGSRNTSIFYPAGMALLGTTYPEARSILACMCEGIKMGNSPDPGSLDFPNSIRLASNYLVAWNLIKDTTFIGTDNITALPWRKDDLIKEFQEAGAVVVSTASYYAVMGIKKGGTLAVYDKSKRRKTIDDRGYYAEMDGQIISTHVYDGSKHVRDKNMITLRHPFYFVKLHKMTPLKYIVLLSLGLSVFRLRIIRDIVKKYLVRMLITGKREASAIYERTVCFEQNNISIEDRIIPPANRLLLKLTSEMTHSTIHMASSDYFDQTCLSAGQGTVIPSVDAEGETIKRTITFSSLNSNR